MISCSFHRRAVGVDRQKQFQPLAGFLGDALNIVGCGWVWLLMKFYMGLYRR